MNNRAVGKAESRQAGSSPPAWLGWIIALFTPRNDRHGRKFILEDIWKEHPFVWEAASRAAHAVASSVFVHARGGFYWKTAIGGACIVIVPFAGVLWMPSVIPLLGLTFAWLIFREAYVLPKERLECEFVTALTIPPLMILFDVVLGAIGYPMVPAEILVPRVILLAVAIAFFRHNWAREEGPEQPYKYLLDLHRHVWFINMLWLTAGMVYLLTLEFAAPAKWHIQSFLATNLPIVFFGSAIRLQLNPIDGSYRHRRIVITLLTDPIEQHLRMMRAYLLRGADWSRNFNMQSSYEILSFALGLAPLVIGVVQWYIGDENAARINWTQMAVNGVSWLLLILTWPVVKKINRKAAAPFDEGLQTLRRRNHSSKSL